MPALPWGLFRSFRLILIQTHSLAEVHQFEQCARSMTFCGLPRARFIAPMQAEHWECDQKH
eukprot:3299816-Amphidinium_carterae.1